MPIILKRELDSSVNSQKDAELINAILLEEGLTVVDGKDFLFKESFNFNTHSGKNQLKIFFPLLKGKLAIEDNNNGLLWLLNIDGLIIKFLFVAVVCFLIFFLLFSQSVIFSFVISFILGGLLFFINWLALVNRVDRLTSKIRNRLKSNSS